MSYGRPEDKAETEQIMQELEEQKLRDIRRAIKESQVQAAAMVAHLQKERRVCQCMMLGLNHGPWCPDWDGD